MEPNNSSVPVGLRLGLPCDESFRLKEMMMGFPMFGPKQTIFNFLRLWMVASGSPNGGLSTLITSFSGSLDVAAIVASFRGGDFTSKDI